MFKMRLIFMLVLATIIVDASALNKTRDRISTKQGSDVFYSITFSIKEIDLKFSIYKSFYYIFHYYECSRWAM